MHSANTVSIRSIKGGEGPDRFDPMYYIFRRERVRVTMSRFVRPPAGVHNRHLKGREEFCVVRADGSSEWIPRPVFTRTAREA